ncbi:MAG: 4a-hydroxytetrahydrobiopterin dehydratase [Bdellovibrionales bacterium]
MTDMQSEITRLSGWTHANKKIRKEFRFETFRDAFAFMTRCAFEIEKMDHHPEWLNVYNKITVELTTHDAGEVTMKDVKLAGIMDRVAARY